MLELFVIAAIIVVFVWLLMAASRRWDGRSGSRGGAAEDASAADEQTSDHDDPMPKPVAPPADIDAPTPTYVIPQPQTVASKREREVFDGETAVKVVPAGEVRRGKARIIDGDSIVIKKTQIRLYGVDAPEIDHPYGQKAKWALVRLCKGQEVHAEIMAADVYGRTVARCRLPDGRDLSAEMVRQGLALDWPKYSGGEYADMEVPGIRKKLWLADARQKGRMHVWDAFEARKKAQSEA